MSWTEDDFVDASPTFRQLNRDKLAGPRTTLRRPVVRDVAELAPPRAEEDFTNEDAFVAWVVRYAQSQGWWARNIIRSRTPAKVTERGEPDILAMHFDTAQIVAAECKMSLTSASTGHQLRTCVGWARCGLEVHVWTPEDLAAIRTRFAPGSAPATLTLEQEALTQRIVKLVTEPTDVSPSSGSS